MDPITAIIKAIAKKKAKKAKAAKKAKKISRRLDDYDRF